MKNPEFKEVYRIMRTIVIFSKDGCHLCERAITRLNELSKSKRFEFKIFDITKEPALFQKYFLSIPVVEIDGEIVFQASDIRTPDDIERKLDAIISVI